MRRIALGLILLQTSLAAAQNAETRSSPPLRKLGTSALRHGSRIQSLVFAPRGAYSEFPDQSLLIAGGGNDPVRIWNVETGQRVRTIELPWVQSLAWNGKNNSLALASAFRTLRTADASEPSRDVKYEAAPSALKAVAANGDTLVAGGADGALLLYSIADKRAVVVPGHKGEINAVATNGNLFASGGSDRTIVLWKLSGGADNLEKVRSLSSPGMVHALVFTPDEKTLISAGDDRVIRLWDAASGTQTGTLDGHKDTVAGLSISSDGKTLAAVGYDETASIWDLAKREKRRSIPIRFSDADAVALSPDGKRLAVAGGANVIRVFDADSGDELKSDAGPQAPLAKVAVSQGRVTALSMAGDVHQWNDDGTPAKTWPTKRLPLLRSEVFLIAAADDPLIATGSSSLPYLELWESGTGKSLGTHDFPAGESLSAVARGPGGKSLALGFRSGLVQVLDWPSRNVRAKMKAAAPVTCVAFATEAPVLATANGGKVQLWDVPTGQPLRSFVAKEETPENQQPAVAALAFSPDGRTIAVSGHDGIIRLLDWTNGKNLVASEGHTSVAGDLAFAPDGRTFATASFDKTARTWETFTGLPIAVFKDHDGPALGIAYSADGRKIYSSGADTRTNVWDATGVALMGSPPARIDPADLDANWATLASTNASAGHPSSWWFVRSPKESCAFLSKQIYLVDPAKIDQLFRDLDANEFNVREKATQELEKYGRWMEGRLDTALVDPPSLEVKRRVERMLSLLRVNAATTLKQERVRMLRVMQALEQMNDPAAVQILESLARGAAEPELQREAEASLKRLRK